MHRNSVCAATLLVVSLFAAPAFATGVTAYGSGLKSCADYLDEREQQNYGDITFLDWLSGFFFGANSISAHANNMLGDDSLRDAVDWFPRYCRAHPRKAFAVAADELLMRSSQRTARHTTESAIYGAGSKFCASYLRARELKNIDEMDFVDWLGGYYSGANAISLTTGNILGDADLAAAVYWIDNFCSIHTAATFAEAAAAMITPNDVAAP